MAEYGSEVFSTIYVGTNRPQTLSYTATQLETGKIYQFKIVALNYNGESEESDVYFFNACNTPTSFDAPYRITSTSTSIKIGWNPPTNDGGCPILGYAVYRDDGAGGNIVAEMNLANDPAVRLIPTLREL